MSVKGVLKERIGKMWMYSLSNEELFYDSDFLLRRPVYAPGWNATNLSRSIQMNSVFPAKHKGIYADVVKNEDVVEEMEEFETTLNDYKKYKSQVSNGKEGRFKLLFFIGI